MCKTKHEEQWLVIIIMNICILLTLSLQIHKLLKTKKRCPLVELLIKTKKNVSIDKIEITKIKVSENEFKSMNNNPTYLHETIQSRFLHCVNYIRTHNNG